MLVQGCLSIDSKDRCISLKMEGARAWETSGRKFPLIDQSQ